MAEAYDHLIKVLLVGEAQCGKTSILSKFANDTFCEQYISTIGVDFSTKFVQVDDKSIKLMIWDTAGQEKFRSITKAYYRGCAAVFIVVDMTETRDCEKLQKWLQDVKGEGKANVQIAILANKYDMEDDFQLSEQTLQKFAFENDLEIFYTSAKSGLNIEEAFLSIVRNVIHYQIENN